MSDATDVRAQAAALAGQAARDGIQQLVAGALVHDRHGRVLILRRAATDAFMAGVEELPSGGVEHGETLLDALERELHEEAGLPLRGPLHYVGAFDYRNAAGQRARQHTWAAPHPGQRVRLSDEHTGHRMVQPQDIRACDVSEETACTVETWAAVSAPPLRHAARAIVVDADQRVLLLGYDENGRFWATPGGSLQPAEDHIAAVRRELREELGADNIDLGPQVAERSSVHQVGGRPARQVEKYFLVHATPEDLDPARATNPDNIRARRWWTLRELRTTHETVHPAGLADLLTTMLANGAPAQPVTLN